MHKRSNFINFIFHLIIFIILEGLAIFLISKNSIIQKYKIMQEIRLVQNLTWKNQYKLKSYFSLSKTNQQLADENARLRSFLSDYQQNISQSKIIRGNVNAVSNTSNNAASNAYSDTSSNTINKQINGNEKPFFKYISAEIIQNTCNRSHNRIIINKGSLDGIKEDMGVITDRGIIGIVRQVSKHFSLIYSFLDIDESVSAIIKKTNTFGPLVWTGTNTKYAIMSEIPIHTEFSVGDTIVSSGYSTIYPANIPLGTIESSEVKDGTQYNLKIKLFENYSSLKFVYVTECRDKEEILSLMKEKEDNNEK